MERTWRRGLCALAAACAMAHPASARGQMTPPPAGPSGASPVASSILSSPYGSPAFNPYLNPMIGGGQDPALARDAALIYLLSQQARGGIGSGMLGGPRAGARAATTNRAPAQMPPAAMVPGSGASRYFNSGQGAPNGMNSFYGRRDRAYPNGRR